MNTEKTIYLKETTNADIFENLKIKPFERAINFSDSTITLENVSLGENLDLSKFIDSQILKMFREQVKHIKAYSLIEAISLGDNHIYRDTSKYTANFIIANPNIKEDLEKLIKDNVLTNKTYLYSNLVDSNEIICIHSDESAFPAHVESDIMTNPFIFKMDNPCLVKLITFSKN